jgi:hypothetical protein
MGRLPAVGVLLLACVAPAARAEGELMYDPVFRESKAGDVLVKGERPLLRGHLDAFVDLTEAAFDVAYPAKTEQALRDALETSYGTAGPGERAAFLDLVLPLAGLREKGRKGDLEGSRAGLRAFWMAVDKRIAAAPREKANQVVSAALERRQATAWKGVPAIHGVAADAWLELAWFVVSLGRNETATPTEGQRTTLLQDLDVSLHAQPEAVRERIKGAHRLWLLAKARWDQASASRRFQLRWEAVGLLARALPADKRVTVRPGPELKDYAREAAAVAAQQTAYDAWCNVARNPEPFLQALTKGLDLPEKVPEDVLLFR